MHSSDTEQIFSQLTKILQRRKLLILSCVIVVLGPIIYLNETQTPTYQASTTMILDEFSSPVGNQGADYSREIQISNRLEELGSYAFAEDVARALPEEGRRRFSLPDPEDRSSKFDEFKYIVSAIERSITAYSVRGSNVVRISVEMADPKLSMMVANTAGKVFQERSARIKQEGASGVRRFIEGQLERFRVQLDDSEEELRQYKESNKISSFDDEAQEILKRTTEAEVLFNTAKTRRKSLEERLKVVSEELAKQRKDAVPSASHVASPWADKLKAKLLELQSQHMQLKVQGYPPTHPKLLQLERDIEQTKQNLTSEVMKLADGENVVDPIAQISKYIEESSSLEIEIESLKAQEEALSRIIDDYNTKLSLLPDKEFHLAKLTRERNVSHKIYTMLLEKLEESKISEAEKIPNVRIIDEAKTPRSPIRPRKKINLAIGMLFGLISGLGAAFVREALNSKLDSSQDLEVLTGWTALSSIPRILELPPGKLNLVNTQTSRSRIRRIKRSIISQIAPDTPAAEAYRMLRTNLQFEGLGDRYRTVLFTSVGPNEGKSTTLSNLAISLAKQGKKTLVLDSEVRRPVQHSIFDATRGPGLSDLLRCTHTMDVSDSRPDEMESSRIATGSPKSRSKRIAPTQKGSRLEIAIKEDQVDGPQTLGKAIQSVRIENLDILTSGENWRDPDNAISNSTTRMTALLEELKHEYEVVLVDTPPLMLVHDTAVMSTLVDGVVFVVNTKKFDREMVLEAKKLLEKAGAHVIGVVLNHIEMDGVYRNNYYSYQNKS